MAENEHIVYILKCKDDTLYTGYTIDLEERLRKHENGQGAKYTRGRGPFQIVFIERHATKSAAMQREYQIKKLTKREKERLISAYEKEVNDNANSEKF